MNQFLDFGFGQPLSLGGAMGLWLGVGVVQLLDTLLPVPSKDGGTFNVKKLVAASVNTSCDTIKCNKCQQLSHQVSLAPNSTENK